MLGGRLRKSQDAAGEAIAALDVASDATERATKIGERFGQAALPTLTAAIMGRVNAANSPSPCP